MAKTELGKAYVQIVPSADGISNSISDVLNPELDAAGRSGGSRLASGIGSALKVGGAAILAGTATATTALAGMGSAAVSAYADYEQLVGGVETLFGDNASQVIANANQAFASAGMSMNDYMETSIQSAAALINSLDGDTSRAADLMDMSITDMADNVNKMGTSMEAVQNAYRGFSRGNFTMLDNLALGFAGSREGMESLLEKAQELSGVEYNIDSYSDIVEAIHVVQEEMGITGTTAEEASGTISGSLSSMKSAWQNLLTGMADPSQNLDGLINNLVNSISAFAGNIVPRIQAMVPQLVSGVTTLVNSLIPIIPPLIQSLLPTVIEGISALLNAIVEMLPDIFQIIIDSFPMILDLILEVLPLLVDVAAEIIIALANGLVEMMPELVPSIIEVITLIVNTIVENLPQIAMAALQIIIALAQGIFDNLPQIIQSVIEIITTIVSTIMDNLPQILAMGIELLGTLIAGLIEAIPDLIAAIPQIISAIWDTIMDTDWLSLGVNIIQGLIDGVLSMAEDFVGIFIELAKKAWNNVLSFFGIASPSKLMKYAGHMIGEGLVVGLTDEEEALDNAVGGLNTTIASGLLTESTFALGGSVAAAGGAMTIPIYIGQEKIDDIVIDAQQRYNLTSGGR